MHTRIPYLDASAVAQKIQMLASSTVVESLEKGFFFTTALIRINAKGSFIWDMFHVL